MDLHEKSVSLVQQMTTKEKAALCSGKDYWNLKGLERLGLPNIIVTDGPHGIRRQISNSEDIGISVNYPAVCFPTASAQACSFDRDLLFEIGSAIGEECRHENVSVILGPGINIKRSPLCGRNFEYYSEDPYLSGHLAAAFIRGTQSQGVGSSLKHFAANNQETRRLTVDAVIDKRTLREIYLSAFEIAVKQAQPWTVMCSYNSVNGEFSSQNQHLLTSILRDEWGFEGLVISDWGSVFDRVKALTAGLDLEMPHVGDTSDNRILDAVQAHSIPEDLLNQAAERIVYLILKSMERQPYQYSIDTHHKIARKAAGRSAVLLKNDNGILPAKPGASTAVIGAFAKVPRYQGTGSSRINPTHLDNACDELKALGIDYEYAAGYLEESDLPEARLIEEACQIAKDKEVVYLFAGLPDRFEAESFDRESLHLPLSHNALIDAVCEVNENVVVVLHCGGVVELPWADKVKAILLMHLGGQAVGGAVADLLTGRVNPSGKLPETWPYKLEDNPSHSYFPGYPLCVEYREGLFVGYRYYDKAVKAVRYPFGYGLSYTSFEYSDLVISSKSITDGETLKVSCKIINTGKREGREVVQLYVAKKESVIIRAEQELKGFEVVQLAPGEQKEVNFLLSSRDFAYYNTSISDWHVENGKYEIRVAASSQDFRLQGTVEYSGSVEAHLPDLRDTAPGYYDLTSGLKITDEEFAGILGRPIPPRERIPGSPHTLKSTVSDIQDRWVGRLINKIVEQQAKTLSEKDPYLKLMIEKTVPDMPLHFFTMMGANSLSISQVEGIVDILNGKYSLGIRKLIKK